MALREYKPTGDELSTALAAGAATKLKGGETEAAQSMIEAAVVEEEKTAEQAVAQQAVGPEAVEQQGAGPKAAVNKSAMTSLPTHPAQPKILPTCAPSPAPALAPSQATDPAPKAQPPEPPPSQLPTPTAQPPKARKPKRAVDATVVLEYRDGKKVQPLVLHVQDSGGQPRFLALLDLLQAPQACIGAVCFSLPDLQKSTHRMRINEIRLQLDAFATRGLSTPLMLVGTRKDEVTGELSELSSFLEKELKGCPALNNLVRNTEEDLAFFGVENSKGIDGDPTILHLIAAIENTARNLPSMKLRVPPGWIAVMDELYKLMSAEQPRLHLSRTELIEIARRCGLPHKQAKMPLEREVDVMLGFLHSLGAVLWFDLPR